MALIKSTNAPSAAKPFSLTDIEEAARRMLLRARRQAEELLAAAQQEAEAMKLAARADGAREGLAEGQEKGMTEGLAAGEARAVAEHGEALTQVLTALTAAATEIDARRMELEAEGLREVVQLAVAIARRVTKRQGLIDEAVLTANLADAMRLVVQKADVRIVIHPQQRQAMEAVLPQLRLEWPALRHVELADDATLAPGGCRIVSAQGRVDADLDGQLDRIVAELLPTPAAT